MRDNYEKAGILVSTLILLCIFFILPASAARFTNQPVTIPFAGGWVNGDDGYETFPEDAYLTINEVEVNPYILNGDGTKDIYISMDGVISHADSAFYFKIHCYDANGALLDTVYEYFYFSDQYFTDRSVCSVTVPETTAMVEFEAYSPGGWTNTYLYSRYINVAADDGRVCGIHDLLEPNYEAVGWHGRVWVYSADGRSLRIAYNEVPAYKAVGWYDFEEYSMIKFRELCDTCFAAGDYESIMRRAYAALSIIEREDYINEVKKPEGICNGRLAGCYRWFTAYKIRL